MERSGFTAQVDIVENKFGVNLFKVFFFFSPFIILARALINLKRKVRIQFNQPNSLYFSKHIQSFSCLLMVVIHQGGCPESELFSQG